MSVVIQKDTDTYLKDEHGNVIGKYSIDGVSQGTSTYDAFGNITSGTIDDPFGYCGEYRDSESGLIYLRNRYYDTNTGRFITEDPAKDGVNWYSYCAGDPVMFVDPTGYLRGPGYNKNGEWSENPDLDDYGEDSVAYKALVTLTEMWENRPDDREAIERLADLVRNTANKVGYETALAGVLKVTPESANEVDIILVIADPFCALEAFLLKKKAENKADELYGEDNDGTIHNAFKHAYWNALMAYNIGDSYAQLVGYSHEFGAPENLKEENYDNINMDLYNNYVGRDIAWNYKKPLLEFNPNERLAELVSNAANSGLLVILR